jgi:hypothetical protein
MGRDETLAHLERFVTYLRAADASDGPASS